MSATSNKGGAPRTPGPSDFVAALAHLTGYNAAAAAGGLAELTRASGELWGDAVARSVNPFDLAGRNLRWWNLMRHRSVPGWHMPSEIVFATRFANLRDFSDPPGSGGGGSESDVVATLVLPPQAGHSSSVVDFSPHQSQLATIKESGLDRLFVLEWRPATAHTTGVTVTDYLDVIDRAIEHMGGRANLIGDCQGGWLAAIYAALYPEKINTLTLAGAPIDFHAGESVIASSTRTLTSAFGIAPYKALVAMGGGNMPGKAVLTNFIAIQPQSEISRQLQLLEHIDDAKHVERYRVFEDWFKYTQDIPGAFYLWLVEHLFWGNELISGDLVIDGRRADMTAITCPLFLLAGSTDHITPPPQLFAAADAVGTSPADIQMRPAAGGHLGLFMGRDALRKDWPPLMEAVHELSVPQRAGSVRGRGRNRAEDAVADPGATPRVPAP